MASNDPPDLPKLPPIRESAEHVLPPLPGDSEQGWEDAPEPVAPSQKPVEAERRERRQRRAASSDRPRRARATPEQRAVATSEEPEGRRRNRTEDGRRYSSAGNALVVALLALLFGALLNAPGMHKASFNKQPGTERDVALALTGGLAGVSGALQLDRPRQFVQNVAGRATRTRSTSRS